MTHTKLFMRQLAYVPWLLTIGLVLGWNGEAVADTDHTYYTNLPTNHAHSDVSNHTHVTDPYLHVSYALDTRTTGDNVGERDSVFVSWSTAYSKNYNQPKTPTIKGNGTEASEYVLTFHKGETPGSGVVAGSGSGTAQNFKLNVDTASEVNTHTFMDTNTEKIRKATLLLDLEATTLGAGFYWVKLGVTVPEADNSPDSNTEIGYFAKQIAVKPDYILSVNPSNVREDVNRTISVTVTVSQDEEATQDTSVPLWLGTNQTGLNSRFRIAFPTLTIRSGEKDVTGTIQFTPIYSETTPDDDLLVTIRTPGDTGGSTDIRLVDTDKESTAINLSFSDAVLTKNDGATDIEVTATLNGGTLPDHVSFALEIDESFPGSARRDVDYTATLRPITIRRRQVSGKATITITPLNEGTGFIRLAPTDAMPTSTNATTDDIRVNPSSLEITSGPATAIKGLTATPFRIREDAGSKPIELEISLQNALLTNETVVFTISDNDTDIRNLKDDRFDDADDADRDVDYRVQVQSLVIPKGETKGTTTMTVTPINNNREDGLRAFVVNATVGGKEYKTGILITDDDTTSDSITLEVSPTEVKESDGATAVTVTGTLNGKVFKDNVIVPLVIHNDIDGDGDVDADDKAATRDLDYTAVLSSLVIPGGSTFGTATITITPTANDGKEGDEKIGLKSSGEPEAIDDDGVKEKLSVVGATITLKDEDDGTQPTPPSDPTRPTFADAVAAQEYTVGTAITPLVLPEASGGTAPLIYSVSTLPAGLSFDAATRVLSGTPTAATTGAVTVVYTVLDSAGNASALAFTITVEEGQMPPPPADAEVQLEVTPAEIREDAGTTSVSLTVTLPAARVVDETVTFTIGAPSEGTPAVRDVDYIASLEAVVTIPVGTTTGRATLTLVPINNTAEDGLRAIGVQATFASGATLMRDIKIVDDEAPSTSITLSADPDAIVEGSGQINVTVTATLNGDTLTEDATVIVAIGEASTATRDVDYSAIFNPLITILAGAREGSTQFSIHSIDDGIAEGDETIKLIGVINGLTGGEAEITLSDQAAPSPPDDSALAFPAGTAIPNQEYTAGTPVEPPLVLPEASGGTAPLRYSVSALPAGLSFDAATRTISGTPSAATDGAVTVSYTVFDSAGEVDALTFTITVNRGLTFDDFFNLFPSGKIVPPASHDLVEIREFVVGQRVEGIVLPEASGGTAPLTYSLSPALPAGLTFDAATRTIVGTPQAASATAYTYAVRDANGASTSLALQPLPTTFTLADNFPNPFNPATTIQYALPQAADVELTVYNVVGQPVRTLVAEHQSAGRYAVEWDATNDSGHSLSSGMYFYRLQAGGEFLEVKKMLLLK